MEMFRQEGGEREAGREGNNLQLYEVNRKANLHYTSYFKRGRMDFNPKFLRLEFMLDSRKLFQMQMSGKFWQMLP